jgi:hypothetical protein
VPQTENENQICIYFNIVISLLVPQMGMEVTCMSYFLTQFFKALSLIPSERVVNIRLTLNHLLFIIKESFPYFIYHQ